MGIVRWKRRESGRVSMLKARENLHRKGSAAAAPCLSRLWCPCMDSQPDDMRVSMGLRMSIRRLRICWTDTAVRSWSVRSILGRGIAFAWAGFVLSLLNTTEAGLRMGRRCCCSPMHHVVLAHDFVPAHHSALGQSAAAIPSTSLPPRKEQSRCGMVLETTRKLMDEINPLVTTLPLYTAHLSSSFE